MLGLNAPQGNAMKTLISAAAAALVLTFTAPAGASEWGCKVALCLASPQDPMQYGACRPPMERYYEELASHDPDLPSCPAAGRSGSRSAIQQAFYDHIYGDTRVAGYEMRPGRYGIQRRVPVNADGEELVCFFNQCQLAGGRGSSFRR